MTKKWGWTVSSPSNLLKYEILEKLVTCIPVSGPCTRWCASTLGEALKFALEWALIQGLSSQYNHLIYLESCILDPNACNWMGLPWPWFEPRTFQSRAECVNYYTTVLRFLILLMYWLLLFDPGFMIFTEEKQNMSSRLREYFLSLSLFFMLFHGPSIVSFIKKEFCWPQV